MQSVCFKEMEETYVDLQIKNQISGRSGTLTLYQSNYSLDIERTTFNTVLTMILQPDQCPRGAGSEQVEADPPGSWIQLLAEKQPVRIYHD